MRLMRFKLFLICGFFLTGSFLFTAESNKIDITADVFLFDARQNVMSASGNVVVKCRDMTVRANRGRYDQVKQVVTLYNAVKLVRGNMRLMSGEVTVYGNENKVVASEKPTFVFATMKGQSDSITYDLTKELVTLTGHAQVMQGKDAVFGDWVSVDLFHQKFRATTRKGVLNSGRPRVRLSDILGKI
ncbi:MAG: hypothetical protein EXS67_00690 [Candidatus Margulisbacteria bacterium]|nr:hypothetical protein [Candidatus Margulisiibacteriota bacterium]